jgi:hypothetical protein
MNLAAGDSVVGLARNAESLAEDDAELAGEDDDEGISLDETDLTADLADQAEADGADDEDGGNAE